MLDVKIRHAVSTQIFLLSILAAIFAESFASATEDVKLEFKDFSSLRSEVLTNIGKATKRVWIASDYLTDAEIVSSLFIAKYRKIDVSVLLGKDRATNILSRLNYLKQVNIPVALRPRDFFARYPTIFLIDEKLYGLSIPLDSMTRATRSSLELLSSDQLSDFLNRFNEAAKLQNAPNMAPLPQVGRSRPNSRYYKNIESSSAGVQKTAPSRHQNQPYSEKVTPPASNSDKLANDSTDDGNNRQPSPSSDGSTYRYRNRRQKPPEGIPTRLPKTTLRQELLRERERQRSPAEQQVEAAE